MATVKLRRKRFKLGVVKFVPDVTYVGNNLKEFDEEYKVFRQKIREYAVLHKAEFSIMGWIEVEAHRTETDEELEARKKEYEQNEGERKIQLAQKRLEKTRRELAKIQEKLTEEEQELRLLKK